MTRRALVTGVTGFIGGKLTARLLDDGWQVDAVVRESSDTTRLPDSARLCLHRHDGTTEGMIALMTRAEPSVVFHLASLYLADHRADQIAPLVASNLLLPAQLMEAMTACGVRDIVNAGTAWQHYRGEPYLPVNLYAATKQAAEDLLAYYVDAKGLSAITLKLFDTYGTGDPRRKLIRILGDAARSGETLDMSPGEQTIDLSHIDDVVDAFIVAGDRLRDATGPLDERYFVSGERMTVRELVGRVETAIGRKLAVNFGGRPYRDREVMMPVRPSSGESLPGWSRQRSVDRFLRPSFE